MGFFIIRTMGERERADGSVRVIGLIGGVAVSTFSKTLALVFGMLVFGVQVSEIGMLVWEMVIVES